MLGVTWKPCCGCSHFVFDSMKSADQPDLFTPIYSCLLAFHIVFWLMKPCMAPAQGGGDWRVYFCRQNTDARPLSFGRFWFRKAYLGGAPVQLVVVDERSVCIYFKNVPVLWNPRSFKRADVLLSSLHNTVCVYIAIHIFIFGFAVR